MTMPRPLREYRPARPGGLLVPSPLEQQSCESVERLNPAVRVNPPPCRPGRYARRALDPVAPREVPHPVLHLRPAVCGIVLREGTRARFRTEEIGCGHAVRVRLARAELRRCGFAPFTESRTPRGPPPSPSGARRGVSLPRCGLGSVNLVCRPPVRIGFPAGPRGVTKDEAPVGPVEIIAAGARTKSATRPKEDNVMVKYCPR